MVTADLGNGHQDIVDMYEDQPPDFTIT